MGAGHRHSAPSFILGSDVEVCLAVFNSRPQHRTLFASLVGDPQQESSLQCTFGDTDKFVCRSLTDFLPIENHPFAYQISEISLNVFREQKGLSESLLIAAGGVKTSDAEVSYLGLLNEGELFSSRLWAWVEVT
jgi:hypothetical protein